MLPLVPRIASAFPKRQMASEAIGVQGSLLMKCPDSLGIVSSVAESLVTHGNNLAAADLHVEHLQESSTLVSRYSFDCSHYQSLGVSAFESDISRITRKFRANASLVYPSGRHVLFDGSGQDPVKRVIREAGLVRVGVFMSQTEHCLLDLLNQYREGDLALTIPFVLSNHPRCEDSSHVRRTLFQLGIPYYYISHPPGKKREWEAEIRKIMNAEGNYTDFLVLARYMQVLSGDFLAGYGRDVINIHHGLLPSFKGANPYRQAHNAGVKLIGATAHFVTDQLDEGPIIEQRVARVSHKDTMNTLRLKSENLEAAALQDAVRYYVENRIARVGGRTVVFA